MARQHDHPPARSRVRFIALLCAGAVTVIGALAAAVLPADATVPCTGNGFQIALDRTGDTAVPGTNASTRVHLVVDSSFTCSVGLSVGALPAGVTAAFSPSTVQRGSAPSQLVLTTSTTSPLGRFPVTITGVKTTGGGVSSTTTFQLIIATVDEAPASGDNGNYALLATRSASSAIIGGGPFDHTAPSFLLERSSSFHDSVKVTAADLPAGVTASVNSGTSSYQVTLTPSATSPAGTFRITINAASLPTHGDPVTAHLHYWLTIAAAPGFSLTLSQNAGAVVRGGAATTVVHQSSLEGGLADNANLAATGLPDGATAAFAPTQVTSAAPSTLTVTTSTTSPLGTFPITITATSPFTGLVETATYRLTIAASVGFTLALDPEFGQVSPGATTTTAIILKPLGGFTGSAGLKVTSRPAFLTVSPTSATVSAGSPAVLTVSAASDAPSGTYIVNIVGGALGVPSRTLTYQITIGDPTS